MNLTVELLYDVMFVLMILLALLGNLATMCIIISKFNILFVVFIFSLMQSVLLLKLKTCQKHLLGISNNKNKVLYNFQTSQLELERIFGFYSFHVPESKLK